MLTSNPCKEMFAPLVKALGSMKNPVFDSVNPHFKSKFASLAAVRNSVVPVYAENGIGVMQTLTPVPDGVRCVTRLIHTSGEWIESDGFVVPVDTNNAHAVCSAGTYAQRRDLSAISCVVGDDDDDGNAAKDAAGTTKAKVAAQPKQAAGDGKPRSWNGLTHEQWRAQDEQKRADEGNLTIAQAKALLQIVKDKALAPAGQEEQFILRGLAKKYGEEMKKMGVLSLWQIPLDMAESAMAELQGITEVVL